MSTNPPRSKQGQSRYNGFEDDVKWQSTWSCKWEYDPLGFPSLLFCFCFATTATFRADYVIVSIEGRLFTTLQWPFYRFIHGGGKGKHIFWGGDNLASLVCLTFMYICISLTPLYQSVLHYITTAHAGDSWRCLAREKKHQTKSAVIHIHFWLYQSKLKCIYKSLMRRLLCCAANRFTNSSKFRALARLD